MQAGPLASHVPGDRDRLSRLMVDRRLRAFGDVFAAGDAAARADPDHYALQRCRHAIPMGKVAGHNAAADLPRLPLMDFAPPPYVPCLDLGADGPEI
ncbi:MULTISPECIES: hypothetical protein [Streptosporangium]|uniref:NADH dehydrogenase FAD-containing subunit n=1 Tax=Streptosporangium brasiliense TaxID=47480 RepID=A0ABT9RFP5_9ACTN|nr:hypothetical protein [Streptosporangium brasiliense]MDP9867667.1 NADH dehydrogenase FAD-containing subunit [Streptosporangium brasiliense]